MSLPKRLKIAADGSKDNVIYVLCGDNDVQVDEDDDDSSEEQKEVSEFESASDDEAADELDSENKEQVAEDEDDSDDTNEEQKEVPPTVSASNDEAADKPDSERIETSGKVTNGINERSRYVLQEGVFSDVTFAVGPKGTTFRCHRVILTIASRVFEAIFCSLEGINEIIKIPDLMPEGFQLLLDYVYAGDMKLKNESDSFEAWKASNKYCLPYMRDKCFKFLYDWTITENNVWDILKKALYLSSEPLEEKCWNYLKKNAEVAIENSSFLYVSQDVIKKLLLIEYLSIKEVSLALRVVRWAQEQIRNGSNESLQELLQPFLGYIRFGCMQPKDVSQFISKHQGIISESDIICIFKYMTDNVNYSLPEWCSKDVKSRKIVK